MKQTIVFTSAGLPYSDWLVIRRANGKIERFYTSVVTDSVGGTFLITELDHGDEIIASSDRELVNAKPFPSRN